MALNPEQQEKLRLLEEAEMYQQSSSMDQSSQNPSSIPSSKLTPEQQEKLRLLEEAEEMSQQSLASQNESPSIGQSFAKGARNVAAGLGDVGDFIASPVREGLNLGASALGYGRPFNPMGESIAQGIDQATEGYTAPQSQADKMSEGAQRAIAGLIPGVGAGNLIAKGGTQLAKNLGQGISGLSEVSPANVLGSGAGAALTEGVLANNPENTGQAATTGILGNIAGQTVGGLLSPGGAARAAGKSLSVNPQKLANFTETGIKPTLGDVSDSNVLKGYQKIAEHTPGSAHLLKNAREEQIKGIQKNLGKGSAGEALTEKDAGELAQKGLKGYKEKSNQVIAQLKDRYQRHLGKEGAEVEINKPLDFYLKTLNKVKSERMQSEIANSPFGKEMRKLVETSQEFGGKIPWNDAEAIRTQLFDLITKQGSVGTISKGQLEHLRGLLNKEMGSYMQSVGPTAAKDWNRYNTFYKNWAAKRKPILDKAEDVPLGSTEKVFDEIIKGKKPNEQALATVNNALKGKDREKFFDSMVERLGKNRVGDWSPNEFQKNYKLFRSEVKDQFKLPLSKGTQQKFDKVMDVIGDMKMTDAMANTSKTEYTKRLIDNAKDISGGVGGVIVTGAAATKALVPTLTALAATHAVTKGMLTNPKFINWAAKGTTLKNPAAWGHHLAGGQQFLGKVGIQEMKEIINHKKK